MSNLRRDLFCASCSPRALALTSVAAVTLMLLGARPAQAIRPAAHLQGHDRLEVADGAAPRRGRVLDWRRDAPRRAAAGWQRLSAELGADWAAWDRVTGVPVRVVGAGVEVPGAASHDAVAERAAIDFVERHLGLLAPGARATDLVLAADDVDGAIRTVAFQQTLGGLEILGATISLRFIDDRLVAVASDAVPVSDAPSLASVAGQTRVLESARGWIGADIDGQLTADGAVEGPFLLPLISEAAVRLQPVMRAEVSLRGPASRWYVYVDAERAVPVAREQLLRHADATLRYDVPLRGPLGERAPLPATRVALVVDDLPTATNGAGLFSFAGPTSSISATASGDRVSVVNQLGDPAVGLLSVVEGEDPVWSGADDEVLDAQLTSYVHARRVQDFVSQVAPELDWIDEQLTVNVNINDVCNAFFDPISDTINFFVADQVCENTGRISDVVFHEYGHAVHNAAIIPGVGVMDGALSEGISDYLAATINGDPGMGVGFFFDDEPLRDIDPAGDEYVWPDDRGEIHYEGLIIAGTLWDLRKLLVEKLGAAAGRAQSDRIWFQSIRRAVDIPSMYFEALVADDDDGDLANGTPNVCEINEAFAAHGLYQIPGVQQSLSVQQIDAGWEVAVDVIDPFPQCSLPVTPQLAFKVRGEGGEPTVVDMQAQGDTYRALLPAPPPTEVLNYQVRLVFESGAEWSYPENLADRWYEAFSGPVEEIWCEDFEGELDGWSGGGQGSEWELGAPSGLGGDPQTAWQGGRVLGNVLAEPGLYTPGTNVSVQTPIIDASGYDIVRVQYRRWLTVEDGFFDQARILANGDVVWENFAEELDYLAHTHHTDREWRFHDVVVTDEVAADGGLSLGFQLVSDGGLQLGGWNIDQLCIVGQQVSACGDGTVDPGEECDDGNQASGDGCDSSCQGEPEPEPQPLPPSGEDEGGTDGEDWGGAAADDGLTGRGCGCATGDPAHPGPTALALLGLLGLVRRRRTH